MIVAVDVGNSNVVLGIYNNNDWVHFWRMPTKKAPDSSIFYDMEIRNRMLESNLETNGIQGVILSTVVPGLRMVFVEVLQRIFDSDVVIVGPDLYEELSYKVPRPYEIGTDLVANAYSAFRLLNSECIVVDFGTALTFTTIDHTGYILGVAIAPGIKTAMKALSSNTAQLPEIPLELPSSVIGLHTTHAMQAGILWGYVGIAKELIQKIRSEVGKELDAIATGGLSFILDPIEELFVGVDTHLTINGLRFMLEDLKKKRE